MSVIIKGMEMPTSCLECEWRDAEAGGDCELMICNPFESYEEQYKHCPFQEILKRYSLVPVPPHGDLIDRDELCDGLVSNHPVAIYAKSAPTIIPASKEGEG